MWIRRLGLASIAGIPLMILFVGDYASRLLRREVLAHTIVNTDGTFDIVSTERATEGVLIHEMAHALPSLLGFAPGPSIVPAALEYTYDYYSSSIVDRAIRSRIERNLAEQRSLAMTISRSTYESLLLDRMDALLQKSPRGVETLNGYYDSADLAALSLGLVEGRLANGRLLIYVLFGAKSRAAYDAVRIAQP
jgi:hypothetical protein